MLLITYRHEKQLTWLMRFINFTTKLKFVNFNPKLKMEVNLKGFRTVEICDFDRQFLFDSYLLNFSSNFTKTVAFKS